MSSARLGRAGAAIDAGRRAISDASRPAVRGARQEVSTPVYAIVRCGGRQEKVSVDDVLTVDRLSGEPGVTVQLPALLVVDGDTVLTDPANAAKYQVTAEILGNLKGPKINIMRYKNKTGYKRRMGHRQPLTRVKVTGIAAS